MRDGFPSQRASNTKSVSIPWCYHNLTEAGVVNSLAPGKFQFNFRLVIFKFILVNGGWGISNKIALRWMPPDLTDDKSTLVQVMAWCRQATSHYLSQCWPRSMSPNGITRPQWVNSLDPARCNHIFKWLNCQTRCPGWCHEYSQWRRTPNGITSSTNDTALLCAKFQNNWTIVLNYSNIRRSEFKLSFRGIYSMAIGLRCY